MLLNRGRSLSRTWSLVLSAIPAEELLCAPTIPCRLPSARYHERYGTAKTGRGGEQKKTRTEQHKFSDQSGQKNAACKHLWCYEYSNLGGLTHIWRISFLTAKLSSVKHNKSITSSYHESEQNQKKAWQKKRSKAKQSRAKHSNAKAKAHLSRITQKQSKTKQSGAKGKQEENKKNAHTQA